MRIKQPQSELLLVNPNRDRQPALLHMIGRAATWATNTLATPRQRRERRDRYITPGFDYLDSNLTRIDTEIAAYEQDAVAHNGEMTHSDYLSLQDAKWRRTKVVEAMRAVCNGEDVTPMGPILEADRQARVGTLQDLRKRADDRRFVLDMWMLLGGDVSPGEVASDPVFQQYIEARADLDSQTVEIQQIQVLQEHYGFTTGVKHLV